MRVHFGIGQRRLRGTQCQIGGQLVRRCDPAFVNARALHDPLIRRIDRLCQIRVGEDAGRQVAAAAEND